MTNIIYKDQKDLVLNNPKIKSFPNKDEKKEAIKEYNKYIKKFIDNLPEKYKSVINLYNEIKNNENINLGLACLLYINVIENEEILEPYYNNGLKHADKERFIKFLSISICEKKISDGYDLYYDEIYNEDLGFLKIYVGINAIKEYYNSERLIYNTSCVKSFYKKQDYSNIYNLYRFFIEETLILQDKEIFNEFNDIINKYDLGIYEQIYLFKYLEKYSNTLNDKISIDEVAIMPYINFVKDVEQKYRLYYLHEIENQDPVKFNELVNSGNLSYNDISELLIFVKQWFNSSDNREEKAEKILDTFNTVGIHKNYKLCKNFLYGYILKDKNNFEFSADILFDVKYLDILYQIKDRSKEEIKLYIKILNTITKKLDIDKILNSKYYYYEESERNSYKKVDDYWWGIKVGEHNVTYTETYSYLDSENYKIFYEKVKKYINNPESNDITLGYNNVTDFRKEYLWEIYHYINKINRFILNNNLVDNFQSFMELLELNENKTELYLSSELKKMLINEGYIKIEISYSLQKKLNR